VTLRVAWRCFFSSGIRRAASAFAFPGGRVEAADAAPASRSGAGGSGGAKPRGGFRTSGRRSAIGFWVTALRELFEEAGMLLGYGPDARPVSVALLEDLRVQRTRCREDSAAFGRLLAERDLTLATDRVGYWAHWITPEERPIRYDTRFFVAAAWFLVEHGDVDALIAAAGGRDIRSIRPRIIRDASGECILLPEEIPTGSETGSPSTHRVESMA
jgi:8-oxo-dGTP pyrophosphatase MutT (NUDIX family)